MPLVIDVTDPSAWDYDALVLAIKDWAARGDQTFGNRVPQFIRLAEERIWRDLRVSQMLLTTTLVIPSGTNAAPLPINWLEFKRITGADQPRIEFVSADTLQEFVRYGDPTKYSIEGGEFLYGQTPGTDLPLTARYYARSDYLSISPTNWLLSSAPSVYLWASLLEGSVFLKNPARVAEYGTLYAKAIEAMETADRAAMSSGSRLRIRPR